MSTSVCQSDPRCSNDSGDRKSSGSRGKAAFTTACAAVWRNITVICADLIAFQALAKARSAGEVSLLEFWHDIIMHYAFSLDPFSEPMHQH